MIKYRSLKKYKYQLMERYRHDVAPIVGRCDMGWLSLQDTTLMVFPGYCWDGCSGPTIDTEGTMRAGLVHDALYQLLREGHIPQKDVEWADRIFHQILRADGVGRFRAWYYLKGVSTWIAHRAAKPR